MLRDFIALAQLLSTETFDDRARPPQTTPAAGQADTQAAHQSTLSVTVRLGTRDELAAIPEADKDQVHSEILWNGFVEAAHIQTGLDERLALCMLQCEIM